jgi:hypothetical protein
MTALDKLKKRHSSFSNMTAGLGRIVSGAIIGSVVTSGIYTGVIQPSKIMDLIPFGKSEVATVPSVNVSNVQITDSSKVASWTLQDQEAAAKASGLNIDPDFFKVEPKEVFLVDASNMTLADAINDRANDQLDGMNLIRKAIEEGAAFHDDRIKGEVKADIILDALNFAMIAEDMDTVAYDNHVFKLARGLPPTIVFNEIVETLNWKRQMVRDAADATVQIADAIRSDDTEAGIATMQSLDDIMANFETATAIEKAAEKLADELEKRTGDRAPSPDASVLSVPSLREALARPTENLRNHFDGATAPVNSQTAKPLSL